MRSKKKIFENFLHKVFPKKEIWIGISWIRLDADWIGWDWRDRRRFLFEAKLMTRWFKKLSHLHLILILKSKEMKRYYRHILMFYIMTESSSSDTDSELHRDERPKSSSTTAYSNALHSAWQELISKLALSFWIIRNHPFPGWQPLFRKRKLVRPAPAILVDFLKGKFDMAMCP